MKVKRETAWIHIQETDGKEMIASPEYVSNLLGITTKLENVFSRINELERKVQVLEKPNRRKALVDFMATLDRPRTWKYIENRVYGIKYSDFIELVNEKKIERIGDRLFQIRKEL